MLVLFLLFMVFVFGGYHRSKFQEREAEKERKLKESQKDETKQ